jgi:hypothetical protein
MVLFTALGRFHGCLQQPRSPGVFALAVLHTAVAAGGVPSGCGAFFCGTLICPCAGPLLAGTVELDRWRVIVAVDSLLSA